MSLSEHKARLLVSRYITLINKEFNVELPTELIEIIFILYYVVSLQDLSYDMDANWDEWDEDTKHDAYEFIDKTDSVKQSIINRANYGNDDPFIFGRNVTKTGISIWRFKILSNFNYSIYWIGFGLHQ